MLPEPWGAVRRILAIRLDNVGDAVMLGPALRAVRDALPDAAITLMAAPAGAQVAPMLPWVDDLIVHRAVWQDTTGALPFDPQREHELVRTLRERRFDAALIFTSFTQSPYPPASICYLAGIPIRVGQSKEFGGRILSQWVTPLPDSAHQTDRNLHLIAAAGFAARGKHLELHLAEDVQRRADDLLAGIGVAPGAPFVLLAPGASCPARRYDPGRFAVVARLLAAEAGLPVVVVGSPREADLVRPILAQGNPAIRSLVGATGVPELAAIIRRGALVIANDSGPMHLADAFVRPMVILYSGTELESQWEPRGAPAALLRRATPCAPCHRFTCPYQMECLDIPPAEVVMHAVRLLTSREWDGATKTRASTSFFFPSPLAMSSGERAEG